LVSVLRRSLTDVEFSWSSVVARRMERQGLSRPLPSIDAAVSAMGGAHAQVRSAAELSIGLRVDNQTPATVRTAIAGGSLVKTYGPRSTVHLLLRDELPLWCAALGAVPAGGSLPAGARLDANQTAAVLEAIRDALSSGESLDTDELGEMILRRLGDWAGDPVVPAFGGWWPRWRQAIALAASSGILAFGDDRGSRVTFVNPGVVPEADTDRALGWLLQRYLATYGPATPAGYGRWLGVRGAWAATQFARFEAELETVTVEAESAVVSRGDTALPGTRTRPITLLPHFDPYVIGSFPRERLFPGTAARRALGRGQAGVHPVLLINGIVAGVWSQRRRAGGLLVTVEPIAKLTKTQLVALDREVDRLGQFFDASTELSVGPVSTGAHK
jgi:hypothetical protein